MDVDGTAKPLGQARARVRDRREDDGRLVAKGGDASGRHTVRDDVAPDQDTNAVPLGELGLVTRHECGKEKEKGEEEWHVHGKRK